MSLDRLPPQNRDAERSVLGSVLRDNDVINDIVKIILDPEYFYFDYHQKIYRAMLEIDKISSPIDLVILAEKLKQLQWIEDIGGYSYLAELWDAAPTAGNALYYAEIVKEKALVRALIHVNTDILKEAYDPVQPADELLGMAERRILEIAERGVTSDTATLQEALRDAFHRMDARKSGDHADLSGVRTGFVDLDNLIVGFQRNELIILAARPSVGKTAFALNFIRHIIVEEGLPVYFVSLEQAKIELAERLLVAQSQVDSHKLRRGMLGPDDVQRILDAGNVLNRAPLFIDDNPSQNMLRITANARRLKKRHDIKMVVIDYLQLIEPESRRDPRQEQVAQISRRLKFLARELQLPVVALAQVNRASEDRQDHRPRLSDLRESGSIEQDADTVMMLHRPGKFGGDEQQEDNTIEVIVAKQRNGPTGEVKLAYVKQYMRFENHAFTDTGGY
ncbi:replicative DNA helicase [Telmatocola sphagniphila]|uniref:Replicative DNA helicase n=1 Tax=Telmatocola sphagniphila TaxID=1123043 RepID=A0A8E6B5Y6_9BACT|nr:replicative DNA helicase [Telmatocola sphagniphila]QVL32502.1 replicative DNA helicase [Telmatocola sphagniphila]